MLTCFHGSVGTPISSMLGLAQLAKALPLLGTTIKRLEDNRALEADMMESEMRQT